MKEKKKNKREKKRKKTPDAVARVGAVPLRSRHGMIKFSSPCVEREGKKRKKKKRNKFLSPCVERERGEKGGGKKERERERERAGTE